MDPSGECQEHASFADDALCGLGILPNGNIIVLMMFSERLLTLFYAKLSLYADLSQVAVGTIDDMIVDGLGRAYVGDLGFDLPPPLHRGAVRVASFKEDAFIRIDRHGHERQRIGVPGRCAVACALGGKNRTTLSCLSAATSPDELRQRKSAARIDVVEVETPGIGYP